MPEPSDSNSPAEPDEGPPPTPFDHPLFLPVLFLVGAGWFGWDTYIQPLEEHLDFNFYGFKLILAAALWFGYKGIFEMRGQELSPYVLPAVWLALAIWFGWEAFGVLGFEHDPLIEYPALSRIGFFASAALVPITLALELYRARRRRSRIEPPPSIDPQE